MPVADHEVTSAGSIATPAISAAVVAGIPPGTPVTKSTCTRPPNGRPWVSSSRRSACTWPRSNSSNSGTTSRSCACTYRSLMNPHGLRNTSSPKLVVPQVSEHESGSASSTVSRCSSGSCTEPPVDSCTTRSVSARSGVDRGPQPPGVQGRPVLAVADVQVDERGAGRLAAPRRLDELVERGRQLRQVGLGVLGAGRATVIRVPAEAGATGAMAPSWQPTIARRQEDLRRSAAHDDGLRGRDAVDDKIHVGRPPSA